MICDSRIWFDLWFAHHCKAHLLIENRLWNPINLPTVKGQLDDPGLSGTWVLMATCVRVMCCITKWRADRVIEYSAVTWSYLFPSVIITIYIVANQSSSSSSIDTAVNGHSRRLCIYTTSTALVHGLLTILHIFMSTTSVLYDSYNNEWKYQ